MNTLICFFLGHDPDHREVQYLGYRLFMCQCKRCKKRLY